MDKKDLRILHICRLTNGKASGIDVIVPEYINSYAKKCHVAVYNLNKENIKKIEPGIKSYYAEDISIEEVMNQENINFVVFHEIYYMNYIKLYKKVKSMGIPYVIIPHGSLRQEAQRQKHLPKVVLNALFFNAYIKNASFVQFLSEKEKDASKGFNSKYRISPNGVHLTEQRKEYVEDFSKEKGLNLVFVGRYSIFYKGLDLLVDACDLIRDFVIDNNIRINLYGVDFEDNLKQLNNQIEEKQLLDYIIVNDGLYGEEKEKVLLEADGFIQTSRSEGQPVGILEAMSYGLVPLVTVGTTFADEVKTKNCGLSCETNVDAIADMIKNAYIQKSSFGEMSNNAIALIKEKYDWNAIVSRILKEYQSI